MVDVPAGGVPYDAVTAEHLIQFGATFSDLTDMEVMKGAWE